MKRSVIPLCLLLLPQPSCVRALPGDTPSPVPFLGLAVVPGGQIRPLSPNTAVADIGTVDTVAAPDARRTFLLRNESKKPLTIVRLEPSCRCTTADLVSLPIGSMAQAQDTAPASRIGLPCTLMPGSRAAVEVTVHTGEHTPGGFTSAVFVFLKDHPAYAALLQVQGTVHSALAP